MKIILDKQDLLKAVNAYLQDQGIDTSNTAIVGADDSFELQIEIQKEVNKTAEKKTKVNDGVKPTTKKRSFKTSENVKTESVTPMVFGKPEQSITPVPDEPVPDDLDDVATHADLDSLGLLEVAEADESDAEATAKIMAQMEGKASDPQINRLFGQRKFTQ